MAFTIRMGATRNDMRWSDMPDTPENRAEIPVGQVHAKSAKAKTFRKDLQRALKAQGFYGNQKT